MTRRRKLTAEDLGLIELIGESRKSLPGGWPTSPETVPVEVAVRAAERAYRRGVCQGAYYLLWSARGELDHRCGAAAERYIDRLLRWRMRGRDQRYARAEVPPEPPLWKKRVPGIRRSA